MHPQLTDKKIACKEFIQALEQCHSDFWAKYTGGCNEIKNGLNTCLRKERIDRTTRNREDAKLRKEKTERALAELHKDD